MHKLILALFFMSSLALAQAYPSPKFNSVNLGSSTSSLLNVTGTQQSLFHNYAALSWELATGTASSPITTAGPSLKVSRTENIPIATCNATFNDNECNAAIYGASANAVAGAPMQLTGVLGTALTYSTTSTGEAVGVQGIARAVGSATAGVAGGYFEGRYDSAAPRSYYYTVGIEARSNNRSGTDAVADTGGGNSFNSALLTCGAGTYSANKCNAAAIAVADSAQFFEGFVVAVGAVTNEAFSDASNAYNSIKIRGTHTYQLNGENFYIDGSGNTSIGPMSNPLATGYSLYVLQAGSSQAYFGSTGSNNSFVNIDNQAGGHQSVVAFQNAGTSKWQVGNNGSNNFFVYDLAASKTLLNAASGGTFYLGLQQNVQIDGTTGAVSVGQLGGTGSRPMCVTAGGLLVAGSLSSGLVTCP